MPILINTYHANLTTPNKEGKSPIQIALEKKKTFIIRILIKHCEAAKLISENDVHKYYSESKKIHNLKFERDALFFSLKKYPALKDLTNKEEKNEQNVKADNEIQSLSKLS